MRSPLPPFVLEVMAFVFGVIVVASCGDAEEPSPDRRARLDQAHAHGLTLTSQRLRARVDQDFRLIFHGGGSLDGASVYALLDEFDPFMARVAGYQVNVLEPRVEDGLAFIDVRLPHAGDAMIGFSTAPRRVAWPPGPQPASTVRLAQHVKTLFFVEHRDVVSPAPSAAMSYRFGLTLEIVPMVDPLPLLSGDILPVQVRYEGPALADAEVLVQRLARDQGARVDEAFRGRTDDVGVVDVPLEANGRYAVTVVHDPEGSGAERIVHRAALVFEIGGVR